MKTKFNFFSQLFILSLALFLCSNTSSQTPWKSLFNGKDLKDWEVKNGTAKYQIVKNTIVGTSQIGTPNTFLCTKEYYSDFILELEVLVAPGLNSGIQFRSNSMKEFKDGRVHGYQSELDTSERAWSAGIFDEARRGWLYPLTINSKGSAAFNNGEWNKVRIEAIGNTIKTFLNGVQCANLVDDMTQRGFIALQVHSIKDKDQEGKTIQWKNIRIITENPEQYRSKNQPHARQVSYLTNTLTLEEVKKGWRLLWDGKTTRGWKGAKSENFPKHGIEIVDGTILFLKHEESKDYKKAGDIVTQEKFDNFELEVDVMLKKGGNSGVKYFVDALTKGDGRGIGLEFQLLDKDHPDYHKGVDGNRTIGSLYDLIAAENLSEANREDIRANGADRWNKVRIVVNGGNVQHWINNIKVVEYNRYSQSMKNLIKKSKYANHSGFGVGSSGRILLQDHSPGDVKFKNIKIREL
tara:strand:+ start:395 stop:1789 length:1395 start_codon:yes stop_codon:yes gene_type:complete